MTTPTLAIVTHTNNNRPEYVEEMMGSAVRAIESLDRSRVIASHHILQCESASRLHEARWDCTRLADYICFLDDDDYLLDGGLARCFNALARDPKAGIAFTNERYVDQNSVTIESPHARNRRVPYIQMALSPQVCHHLVLIRTSAIDSETQRLSRSLGMADEWLMKANTGIRRGAIHIPLEGYAWRRHSQSHSLEATWNDPYANNMHLLRSYLSAQVLDQDAVVPLDLDSL